MVNDTESWAATEKGSAVFALEIGVSISKFFLLIQLPSPKV